MKKLFFSIFTFVIALTLVACGSEDSSNDAENTSESTESSQEATNEDSEKLVVRVGTSPTYPPFESEENGELVGFDIDLIEKIAEVEDFEIEFATMQFDGLIPALKNGQVDILVGAITITEERLNSVDFSNAYYLSGLSVLTMPDSGINGYEDLDGKLVGIQKGTSSYNYLIQNGFNESNIKQYADISTAYTALENGGIDAILYDNPSNINYIQTQDTDAVIVGEILNGEYYGIAVNPDKPELLEKVNNGLKKLQENGEYEALFDEHLNGEKNGLIEGVIPPEEALVTNE